MMLFLLQQGLTSSLTGWKGGALLDLSQSRMIRTPTSRDIVANYHWLIAIVRASPQKDISFKQFS